MGKVYTNDVQGAPVVITQTKPSDDRLSVTQVSDLYDLQYCYHGMIVSVVGGANDENNPANGVYQLIRANYKTTQSWDSSANNYDVRGWRRIDNSSVHMNAEQFNGNGTQQNPYAVTTIDGGNIANTSNQQNI